MNRFSQWLVITFLLLGFFGGYFWYRTKAGVTVNKSPIPSELSASGLVGYWTFDGPKVDSVNGFAYDSSTSGNTGSFTVSAIAPVTGKIGQAIHMNGTAWEAITLNSATNLEMGTGDMTISSWINITSATNTVYIFSKSGQVSSEGYNIWYYSDQNTMTVSVGTGAASTSYGYDLPISLIGSSWHLVTCVIDRDTGVLFYLDGAFLGKDGSSVYNGTDITSVSEPVVLGYTDANADVVSYDDIRVYSRVLSASEIYQLYTSGNAKINAPPESPLSQSLRGYWKLDDGSGTNATDSSGNANTLAMTGSPSWTTGQIGPYALDFSGTAQYLSVADPSSGVLDIGDSTDFSITGWFNRDTFANDHTIVAKRNSSATNTDAGYIVWIDAAADKLNFTVGDGGGTSGDQYTLASASTFTATGWHQFAAVWDDSLGMQLYIDGKLDNSTTSSTSSIGSLANAVAFRIGAESDAGNPFDGKIDDVRVYGYALSTDQVKKLYQTTSPTQPIDTSLVGHWTFDGTDINGTTAIDRSSFGNNGTIIGATKTIGKLGQALSFNGTSDYVSMGTSLDIATKPFSLSAWVRPTSHTSFGQILSKRDTWNVPDLRFSFTLGDVGNPGVLLSSPSTNLIFSYETPLNTWSYLVVVAESSSTYLYVNGVLNETLGAFILGTDASAEVRVGNVPVDGEFFSGIIDDIRVYNRALSAAEVAGLYNMGK